MSKLSVFVSLSLDGYFSGPGGDMSWAHRAEANDAEWTAFVADNASNGGRLLFGRVTYEMMVSYWPTPQAAKNDPVTAKGMNELPKFVFSRTLDRVTWNNTTLLKGDLAAEVRKLKQASTKDIVILGSGSIVSQLAQEGLIDDYQIVVIPVAIGKGRSLFEGGRKLPMRHTTTRSFRNGNVLLGYEPAQ